MKIYPDVDGLTALLDLGVVEDRDHLVRLLQERRADCTADLIAIAETRSVAPFSSEALEKACREEFALCEEALAGLGEPFVVVEG